MKVMVCARFGCVGTACKKYINNARINLVAIADVQEWSIYQFT